MQQNKKCSLKSTSLVGVARSLSTEQNVSPLSLTVMWLLYGYYWEAFRHIEESMLLPSYPTPTPLPQSKPNNCAVVLWLRQLNIRDIIEQILNPAVSAIRVK